MWLKNKTILVAGSEGFIAKHLVRALKKENPRQIIKLDLKTGYNLCEYRELEAVFKDSNVDIVFDLATLPLPMSLKEPYKVVNDITKMTLNLCELQRLGYFNRLVHISSSEVYGSAINIPMDEYHPLNPRTPYAAAKASADMISLSYFRTFGSDIIIPRSFNAYGPGQPASLGAIIPKTINTILNGEEPAIYNDGLQTRDFVFVKDIARGIIEVAKLRTSGIVVNIGTGVETSIKDLIVLICGLMNYKGEIKYLEARQGDVCRHCSDAGLLYSLTGYKPMTKLEDGLKETIEYYTKLHSVKAIRS